MYFKLLGLPGVDQQDLVLLDRCRRQALLFEVGKEDLDCIAQHDGSLLLDYEKLFAIEKLQEVAAAGQGPSEVTRLAVRTIERAPTSAMFSLPVQDRRLDPSARLSD
jgi:hypothetical protein